MLSSTIVRPLILAVALLAGSSHLASAQDAGTTTYVSPTQRMARRTELEATAAYHDRLAVSPAYSERTRARARWLAELARTRLRDGDFRVGDRIHITATGNTPTGPSQLADTVTVLEGRRISLAGYGPISLEGVLRVELEAKLLTDMTAVVRSILVTARPLMRIAVFGAVARPGYYSVPQEVSLDEVLSRAGGPLASAEIRKTEVTRADTVLLNARDLGAAIARGTTLDALGLQDGDALMVPLAPLPWDRNSTIQIVSMFLMPLLTIFAINRP